MSDAVLSTEDLDGFNEKELAQIRELTLAASAALSVAKAADRELQDIAKDVLERKKKAEDALKMYKGELRSILLQRRKTGGVKYSLGDYKVTLSKSQVTYEVDNSCLDKDWVEYLSDIKVDGRDVIVPTLDTRLLLEGARRGVLDLDELQKAGIVKPKQRLPSVSVRRTR